MASPVGESPLQDEVALVAKNAIYRVGEVDCDLRHGCAVRIGCDSCDVIGVTGMVDDEQGVVRDQPSVSPDFGREEVGRADLAGVCSQRGAATRPDVRAPDDVVVLPVVEFLQFVQDAAVAPRGVVRGLSRRYGAQKMRRLVKRKNEDSLTELILAESLVAARGSRS